MTFRERSGRFWRPLPGPLLVGNGRGLEYKNSCPSFDRGSPRRRKRWADSRISAEERKLMSAASAPAKGLEGIVAATSSICYIDGEKGVLAYRGIDIHELADNSTFEETCYLLWFGRLPSAKELEELRASLAAERKLDSAIFNLLRELPPHSVPMEVLRTAVSALSFYDPDEAVNDHDANVRKTIRDRKSTRLNSSHIQKSRMPSSA